MGFVWLAVMIFSIIVEATTAGLVSIWFAPGALIAMIMAFLGADILAQIGVFVVVSAALIVLALKFVNKRISARGKGGKTNTDLLIGETGIVTEKIDNIMGTGEVRVKSQIWSARSVSDDITVESGKFVKIKAISGVKMICEEFSGYDEKTDSDK